MNITSSVFAEAGPIPDKYTCRGVDVNPPLAISGVPEMAKSLALIMDDPDAPRMTWVHWVLWNIGTGTGSIGENSVPPGASQGMNDFRKKSYGGPCPPSGTHRYFFKLYALDTNLELKEGSEKKELEKAMEGHIVATAQLMGTYRIK